ncbi:MAG: glutathione S-transferase family protein [Filomicrobium sp.]
MKLYEFNPAPNPRRVRMFLAEKGIKVDMEQVDIFKGENLSPEYRAINPRGMIPTLVFDDGSFIDETMAICRYFEAEQPEPSLFGKTPREQGAVESWVRRIEHDGIAQAAYVIRNSNPAFENRGVAGLDDCPQIPDLVERGRKGLTKFFKTLDDQLAKNEFIAGSNYSAADINALCAVDFAEFVGVTVPEDLTHLSAWRQKVTARESSKA